MQGQQEKAMLFDSEPTVHDCHGDAGVIAFPADFDHADYCAYLDDLDAKRSLQDAGPTEPSEPEPQYMSIVSVEGRRFAAAVKTPDGRKIKCGTWPTEMQAWAAADHKVAELRDTPLAKTLRASIAYERARRSA